MANLYEPPGKQRIRSIDILRGVIMLIMALDHTRDFLHNSTAISPTDMATTTPILFFTRWVTHFCAPNFVFLSGISAYIAGTRRTKNELSAFLIKRGLWIVFVEIVVFSFAFTLNPLYNYVILQVLWVIGLSMVILGLLVRTPLVVIGIIGALIFFGHDIFDYMQLPQAGFEAGLLKMLFVARGSVFILSQNHIVLDLYALLPWTGVMLLGYVVGSLYKSSFDPRKRIKILRYTGLALIGFFLVFRFFNIYGDPAPWGHQRNEIYTFLSFLNVSKYPPSLLFLCTTIGPGLLVLSFTERIKNKLVSIFTIYGSVPFFYFVLHFYVIRIITVVVFFAKGYTTSQINTPGNPFLFNPPHAGFSLAVVYLIWLLMIISLYFPCRWFSNYKKTHKQWWLSYL